MGCFSSHEEGASSASSASSADSQEVSAWRARPSLLPRACANKMLSLLHPKNHTVPVLRHTVRVARFQIHLDVWVAEQLARRRGSGSAAQGAGHEQDCEVLENAAFTELSPTPDAPSGPCCSASPTVQRDVIVEPRPADADDAEPEDAKQGAEEVAHPADEVAVKDHAANDQAGNEDAVEQSAASEEVLLHPVVAEVPDDGSAGSDAGSSAPGKSLETAV